MKLSKLILQIFRDIICFFKRQYNNHNAFSELKKNHPTCTFAICRVNKVRFGKYNAIHKNVVLNDVIINDYSYIACNSVLTSVRIGKFCSIASNVQIGLSPHPTKDYVSTYPAFFSKENSGCLQHFRNDNIFDDSIPPTILKNDVWIGANVIIPGGVLIGNGAVVAAGAVVTRDVPPYAVVAGVPARVIKYRFSKDKIESLEKIAWWDWNRDELKKNADLFEYVDEFLKRFLSK